VILVNVAGMLREPPGASREMLLRDRYVAVGPDVELAGPIDGEIRMQRTNRGILLRGSVRASLRRSCARCLDPYVEEVRVNLAEEFLPTVDPVHGHALPAPATDEDALLIDAQHQIDLGPVLRDELVLTEPMHPLCQADCPGLCSVCGRHLDVGSCDCITDEPDPRLAGLASLLERPPR
jgi:DUF177 domain-containing protein